MNIYEQLRIISLSNVVDGPADYQYRKACRYFSTTFNTPLSNVEALPMDYFLTNYYEHVYESMEEDDNENERLSATKQGDTDDDHDKFIEDAEEQEIKRHKRKDNKQLRHVRKAYINPKLLKNPNETQSLSHTETLSPYEERSGDADALSPTKDLAVGLPGPDDEDPSGEM